MKCAYASALMCAVDFAVTKNRNLFTEEEIDRLTVFHSLPYESVRLYGRLLTRKAKWVKISKTDEYFKETDDPITTAVTAANSLIQVNLMESLLSQNNHSTLWDIAETSFGAEDWSWLTQRLTGGKPKAGLRKEEVIRALRRTIDTQKTCFGKSLKERFIDMVKELVGAVHRSDWVKLRRTEVWLVRRTQRLLQAPSDVSGASDVSAYRPLEICVPLFVTFKLLRLPSYQLSEDVNADENSKITNSFLFPSRKIFQAWEAAIEFRGLLSELDLLSHQRDDRVSLDFYADVLSNLREIVLCSAVSRAFFSLWCTLLCPKSLLPAFTEADDQSKDALAAHMTLLVIESFTGLSLTVPGCSKSVEDSTSTGTNTVVEASEFSSQLAVLAVLLMLALLSEADSNSTRISTKDTNNAEKEYLLRFRAVTQLCGCVSQLAAECEKRTTNRHLLALLLYELLLSLPKQYHTIQMKKRGSWYKRVIVDLDLHLKRPVLALALSKHLLFASLSPSSSIKLLESDEVDLRDRVKALSQRLRNQQAKKRPSSSSNSIKLENSIVSSEIDIQRSDTKYHGNSVEDIVLFEKEGEVEEIAAPVGQKRKRSMQNVNNPDTKKSRNSNDISTTRVKTEASDPDFTDDSNEQEKQRKLDTVLSQVYAHLSFTASSSPATSFKNIILNTEKDDGKHRRKMLSALILQHIYEWQQEAMSAAEQQISRTQIATKVKDVFRNPILHPLSASSNYNSSSNESTVATKTESSVHATTAAYIAHPASVGTFIPCLPSLQPLIMIKTESSLASSISERNIAATSPASTSMIATPASAISLTWQCSTCTFTNYVNKFKLSCAMCGQRRSNNTNTKNNTNNDANNSTDNNMTNSGSDNNFNTNNVTKGRASATHEKHQSSISNISINLDYKLKDVAVDVGNDDNDSVVDLLSQTTTAEEEELHQHSSNSITKNTHNNTNNTSTISQSTEKTSSAHTGKVAVQTLCADDVIILDSDDDDEKDPNKDNINTINTSTNPIIHSSSKHCSIQNTSYIPSVDNALSSLPIKMEPFHGSSFDSIGAWQWQFESLRENWLQISSDHTNNKSSSSYDIDQSTKIVDDDNWLQQLLSFAEEESCVPENYYQPNSTMDNNSDIMAGDVQGIVRLVSSLRLSSSVATDPSAHNGLLAIDEVNNNSYYHYNANPGKVDTFNKASTSDYWSVSVFTVHGRRQFLQPTVSTASKTNKKSSSSSVKNENDIISSNDVVIANNTGKSRFYIERKDAMGNVEELVQDKLQFFDIDELAHLDDVDDDIDEDNMNNDDAYDDKDEKELDDNKKFNTDANTFSSDSNSIMAKEKVKRRVSTTHISALRRFLHLPYCQMFRPLSSSHNKSRSISRNSKILTLGDGWQGWHCEGSLVRCLIGLLLWDVVFTPLPDVLLTPYQTAPLDFGHPSFFNRRKRHVLSLIHSLAYGQLSQPHNLLAEVKRLFLSHRGCVARHLGGMLSTNNNNNSGGGVGTNYSNNNYSHNNYNNQNSTSDNINTNTDNNTANPIIKTNNNTAHASEGGVSLRLLQLLALCLGPACLARLCLAAAMGHSQWRSGAPDLLLLRVSTLPIDYDNDNNKNKYDNSNTDNNNSRNEENGKQGKQEKAIASETADNYGNNIDGKKNNNASNVNAISCNSNHVSVHESQREIIPLETLLGDHWQQLYSANTSNSIGSSSTNANNYTSTSNSSGGWGQEDWAEDFCAPPTVRQQQSQTQLQKKVKLNANSNSSTSNSNYEVEQQVQQNIEEKEDELTLPLVFPTHLLKNSMNSDSSPNNLSHSTSDNTTYRRKLVFEAMFVEVKGPTDSLAYKQWLWLHLLNLRSLPPASNHCSSISNETSNNFDDNKNGNYVDNNVDAYDCYAEVHDRRRGRDRWLFTSSKSTTNSGKDIDKNDTTTTNNNAATAIIHSSSETAVDALMDYEQVPVRAFVCLVKEASVLTNKTAKSDKASNSNHTNDSITENISNSTGSTNNNLVVIDIDNATGSNGTVQTHKNKRQQPITTHPNKKKARMMQANDDLTIENKSSIDNCSGITSRINASVDDSNSNNDNSNESGNDDDMFDFQFVEDNW